MLGYDLGIIYKKGKHNRVVDALLRKGEDVVVLLCAISIMQSNWIVEEREESKNDLSMWMLNQNLQKYPSVSDTFVWKKYSQWYKNRIYICKKYQLN